MKNIVLLLLLACSNFLIVAQLPPEKLLWSDGIPNNPVKYKEEKMRTYDMEIREGSLSHMNRVFSCVSESAYILYQPEKGKANGIAMVICPGGGFRDLWIDREGNDFALWLAEKGITSLVLKYRTFNSDEEGFTLERDTYNPEVYADARQAVHILRSQADRLGIDKNKIGIGGFSAGGALSIMAMLELYEDKLPSYAKFEVETQPNFACLVYPGIRDNFIEAVN
ncbi:MAG: alpha/beta hydrolase [Prolixibacteraceae bacterium]|jgi:acetyl esterase/lipase|nr:alpha/beta hydrolase [Prolixibacteraceae bacterium]